MSRRHFVVWALGALAVGALLGAILLTTSPGWRVLAAAVPALSGGRLTLEAPSGAFCCSPAAVRVVYDDGDQRVEIDRPVLDWSLPDLLRGRLTLRTVAAKHVAWEIRRTTPGPLPLPQSLSPPIALSVGEVAVADFAFKSPSGAFVLTDVRAAGVADATRLVLRTLHARSPLATLDGSLEAGAQRPFPVRGEIRTSAAAVDLPCLAPLILAGDLVHLALRAACTEGDFRFALDGLATPFEAIPLHDLHLAIDGVDPARWRSGWPHAAARLETRVQVAAGGAMAGVVDFTNSAPAALDRGGIPLGRLAGRLAGTWSAPELAGIEGDVDGGALSGGAAWPAGGPRAELSLRGVDVASVWSALVHRRVDGTLAWDAAGTDNLRIDLQGGAIRLHAGGRVDAAAVVLHEAVLQDGAGELAASGQLALGADRAFSARVEARGLDPSRWGDYPSARLTGEASVEGHGAPALVGTGRFALKDSRWRGEALTGEGEGRFEGGRVQSSRVDVAVGTNRLKVSGGWGEGVGGLQWTLDAPQLSVLGDGFGGRVQGNGSVTGSVQQPSVVARLTASGLKLPGGREVARADLDGRLSAGLEGALQARGHWSGVRGAGPVESGTLEMDGTRAQHRIVLGLKGGALDLDAQATGGLLDGPVWSGRLTKFANRGRQPVELQGSAEVRIGRGEWRLAGAVLRAGGGELRVVEMGAKGERWGGRGDLKGMPLAWLEPLLPQPPAVRTTLTLDGSWQVEADRQVNGQLELHRVQGDMVVVRGHPEVALGLDRLTVRVDVAGDRLQAKLDGHGGVLGRVQASGGTVLTRRDGSWGVVGSAPLTGVLELETDSLKWLGPWLNAGLELDGRVRTRMTVGGTVGTPRFDGSLDGEGVRVALPEQGVELTQGRVAAKWREDRLTLEQATFRGGDGTLTAVGNVQVTGGAATMDVQLEAKSLQAVRRPDREIVASGQGRLTLRERLLAFSGDLRPERIRLGDQVLRLRPDSGTASPIRVEGSMALDNDRAFRVRAAWRGLDPSRWGDYPSARLTGEASVEGHGAPALVGTGRFALKDSRWRGEALTGEGEGRFEGGRVQSSRVDVAVGTNRLKVSGGWGEGVGGLQWTLDAPQLSVLGDGFGGRVQGNGSVTGSVQQPSVVARLTASGLKLPGGREVARADLDGRLSAGLEGALQARGHWSGVRGAGPVESGTLEMDGTRAQHRIVLGLKGGALDLDAQATGGLLDGPVWSGRLTKFANRGRQPVELQGSAEVRIGRGEWRLAGAVLRAGGGELRVVEMGAKGERWGGRGDLKGMPLAWLEPLLPQPPAVRTTLTLDGSWQVEADRQVNGQLELHRVQGDMVVVRGHPEVALGLDRLTVRVDVAGDRLQAKLDGHGGVLGRVQASGGTVLTRRDGSWGVVGSAPLTGVLELETDSLKWLGPWLNAGLELDGRVRTRMTVGGTVGTPRFDGSLDGEGVRVALPEQGVELTQGRVAAKWREDRLTLEQATFRGGDGTLTAVGNVQVTGGAATMDVQLEAKSLQAVRRPDREIVASGQGRLTFNERRLRLVGKLRADSARFELGDNDAPALGSDVVVLQPGQDGVPQKPGGVAAEMDLDLDLGERCRVNGRGFEGRVAGVLQVRARPGTPLAVNGTVRLEDATYNAYGQRLAIERGNISFAGPMDNPTLDVVAMRHDQAVEAGVQLSGSARTLRATLVSRPAVPDVEKLSWLVLGHGVEAGNRDQLGMLSAAASVLMSRGDSVPVQQRVMQDLGLSEIGLRGNGELGTRVLAVGKRVSSRAYVTYEQALSGASNALAIRYMLSKNWSVQARAGNDSAVDLFYTLQFDRK